MLSLYFYVEDKTRNRRAWFFRVSSLAARKL